MRKSYVTSMPNHIGAFLKASECFADLGINITRVSYNKAVDSHALFIDAEGPEESLKEADARLYKIGYLQDNKGQKSLIILEFHLEDVPGSVTTVLRLITEYGFNISYISSQQDGSERQKFKMGLLVEDPDKVNSFLEEVGKMCPVRIIDYNQANDIYDNSIFYSSFVSRMLEIMDLPSDKRDDLMVNSNLAMQTMNERGLSPYHAFNSIGWLAELLAACKGNAFSPRVTVNRISDRSDIILIEPPCGSNTAIIRSDDQILFVDSGYACYTDEMLPIIENYVPDFRTSKKVMVITHADLDHVGLGYMFDEVLMSENSAECLMLEDDDKSGFREMNPLHKPYIAICKILVSYKRTPKENIKALWRSRPDNQLPLYPVGTLQIGEFVFEVYEGRGGHLKGEIILIDYSTHVAFTGDIYVNIKGMTADQTNYNKYAPILMSSVDTDPDLCKAEREAFFSRLGPGDWKIFGGHGGVKEYSVERPAKK